MVSIQDIFKACSDPIRLKIIKILLNRDEIYVNQLAEILNEPQSKISRHLSILRGSKIVDTVREGIWIKYFLIVNPEIRGHIKAIIDNEENLDKTARIGKDEIPMPEKPKEKSDVGATVGIMTNSFQDAEDTIEKNIEQKKQEHTEKNIETLHATSLEKQSHETSPEKQSTSTSRNPEPCPEPAAKQVVQGPELQNSRTPEPFSPKPLPKSEIKTPLHIPEIENKEEETPPPPPLPTPIKTIQTKSIEQEIESDEEIEIIELDNKKDIETETKACPNRTCPDRSVGTEVSVGEEKTSTPYFSEMILETIAQSLFLTPVLFLLLFFSYTGITALSLLCISLGYFLWGLTVWNIFDIKGNTQFHPLQSLRLLFNKKQSLASTITHLIGQGIGVIISFITVSALTQNIASEKIFTYSQSMYITLGSIAGASGFIIGYLNETIEKFNNKYWQKAITLAQFVSLFIFVWPFTGMFFFPTLSAVFHLSQKNISFAVIEIGAVLGGYCVYELVSMLFRPYFKKKESQMKVARKIPANIKKSLKESKQELIPKMKPLNKLEPAMEQPKKTLNVARSLKLSVLKENASSKKTTSFSEDIDAAKDGIKFSEELFHKIKEAKKELAT
ncbi:metalloregulator ArsR/SmtB family transcription factor [Candidatus Margulisiibacteriota bacterium]